MATRLTALQEKYPVQPKRRLLRSSKSKNEFLRKSEMAKKMKDLQCFESQPYRDFIDGTNLNAAKTSVTRLRKAGTKIAILGKSPLRKSTATLSKTKSPNRLFSKSPYEVPKRFRLPESNHQSGASIRTQSIQRSATKHLLKPMHTNATNHGNSRIMAQQH